MHIPALAMAEEDTVLFLDMISSNSASLRPWGGPTAGGGGPYPTDVGGGGPPGGGKKAGLTWGAGPGGGRARGGMPGGGPCTIGGGAT